METTAPWISPGHLELVPLADRALVDVAGEDQLRAGVDEAGEHLRRVAKRASSSNARALRSGGGATSPPSARPRALGPGPRGRGPAAARGSRPTGAATRRTEFSPTTSRAIGREDGLGGLPVPLELVERLPEPGRERVGNVVVAGDRQHRRPEERRYAAAAACWSRLSAVREVSACDDELGLDSLDQGAPELRSAAGPSVAPTWRSERCRSRVG